MRQFFNPELAKAAEIADRYGMRMMATGGPYDSFQSYVGINKEVTRGTAPSWIGAAPLWLPVQPNPTLTPNLSWQADDSLRGSPVDDYDEIPLTRHDEFDMKGYTFADTFPGLLVALLGGTDSVAGTTAPYTHTLKLLNDPLSGSQPPSWSMVDVDLIEETAGAAQAKQMTAGQLSELNVDFAATGALGWSSKFISNPYTEIAKPTASFSTEVLIPAYNGVISFGGSQSFVLTKGSLAMKRSAAPIFTIQQNSGAPYRLWAGPFNVQGTFEFVALSGETAMLYGLQRQHQIVVITFVDPVSSHSVSFTMSGVQFEQPKVMRDQPYTRVTTNFKATANTTDASSGYSPLSAAVVNGVSGAYN